MLLAHIRFVAYRFRPHSSSLLRGGLASVAWVRTRDECERAGRRRANMRVAQVRNRRSAQMMLLRIHAPQRGAPCAWSIACTRTAHASRFAHASTPGRLLLRLPSSHPVAHVPRRRTVRVAADSWRMGGGMPPPGKLFASEDDYGDDFDQVTERASGERKVGVVKWFNPAKVGDATRPLSRGKALRVS
jgi:hypothetical protein